MQEQSVSVRSGAANGTSDLLSRLYREIGISAVAAALEAVHRPEETSVMVPALVSAQKPAKR